MSCREGREDGQEVEGGKKGRSIRLPLFLSLVLSLLSFAHLLSSLPNSPFPLPSPSTHNVENSPRAMFHAIIAIQKVADRIRLAHMRCRRDRFARHIVLVVEVFEFVVLGGRRAGG